jgi:xanthine dehydrogenase accessory factor
MRRDLLAIASDFTKRSEAFALATVVRREPPTSSQLGDQALITPDGALHGWLGGSCTRSTVVREALRAIKDGSPRLIAFTPDPSPTSRQGVLLVPMTCHSGGSVDVYIDPVLPVPRLLVFGVAPVAQCLVRLGKALGYRVGVAHPSADPADFPDAERVVSDLSAAKLAASGGPDGALFAVVAAMGDGDEEAAQAALSLGATYIGVVASRKRFAEIRQVLAGRGVADEQLDGIEAPAGLDIGARTQEEIALSVLARIVQLRRARQQEAAPVETAAGSNEERDPVCGMMVSVAGAQHRAESGGRSFYFCCAGCRERFLSDPEQYLGAGVS